MGRARKPLELQNGHLTVSIKQQKELEEQLSKSDPIGKPRTPSTLVNDEARKLWKEAIKLLKTIPAASCLDLYNVEGMCNAWGMYRETCRELQELYKISAGKAGDLTPEQNELRDAATARLVKQGEEFRKFARNCGFTVDSRLKLATTAAKKTDDEIAKEFGDI